MNAANYIGRVVKHEREINAGRGMRERNVAGWLVRDDPGFDRLEVGNLKLSEVLHLMKMNPKVRSNQQKRAF